MGYDLARFIGEIEEEFVCSICTRVLQNPLQTSCEHMFCQMCIQNWLLRNQQCPEDHKPLTVDQLKAPGRVIRNLLNKLIIRCDFQRQGCRKMVMLEYLEDHCDKCEFNPKFVLVRDIGNNSFVLPDELLSTEPMNLVLEKRVEEKRTKVEEKSIPVEEKRAKIEEKSAQVEVKSAQVEGKSAQVEVKSVKVIPMDRKQQKKESVDKNVCPPLEKFGTKKKHQPKPLHEPNSIPDTDTLNTVPTKWQVLHNFKANGCILEVKTDAVNAFAQSPSAINPADPSFKVRLLDFDELKYMAIGLTCTGHRVDKIPGLHGQSIAFDSSGDLIVDRISTKVKGKWYAGDIIECGIKFPDNYTYSESGQLKVYFHRNGELIVEKRVSVPADGFFPTIYTFEGIAGSWWNKGEMGSTESNNTKIKYFK